MNILVVFIIADKANSFSTEKGNPDKRVVRTYDGSCVHQVINDYRILVYVIKRYEPIKVMKAAKRNA